MGIIHSHFPKGSNNSGPGSHPPSPDPPSSPPPPPHTDSPPPEQSPTVISTPNPNPSTSSREIATTATATSKDQQPIPTGTRSPTTVPTLTTLQTFPFVTTVTESITKDGSTGVDVSVLTIATTGTGALAQALSDAQLDKATSTRSSDHSQNSPLSQSVGQSPPLEAATVFIATTSTLTNAVLSTANPTENSKANGFLSNKPAAIATIVISSILFIILLGICTRLVYKYRRRKRRQRSEEEGLGFDFFEASGHREGALLPNRRGNLVHGYHSGHPNDSPSYLITVNGRDTDTDFDGKHVPPPEYREEGYGFSNGTNGRFDEKPREEHEHVSELKGLASHHRFSHDTAISAQSSRTSVMSA